MREAATFALESISILANGPVARYRLPVRVPHP
jgi:hypothetical protein